MRVGGIMAAICAQCGALALSAPGHADHYEFISQLDDSGVSY
jgi:hypothetical protein